MGYVVRAGGGTIAILNNGGNGLYANGTGTASFDHYRATQYPDPALNCAPVLPRLGTSLVQWNAVTPANTASAVSVSTDGVNWTEVSAGLAMAFDGSTGNITLPTSGLPTGANPWSLEAWCSVPIIPVHTYNVLINFGTFNTGQMAGLSIQSNGTTAQFLCTTYGGDILSSVFVTPGLTYHVVGTYDGTNTRLYVNGALVAGPTPFTLNIALASAHIGAENVTAQDFFSGTTGRDAIYNFALSAGQVLNNFNVGSGAITTTTYDATIAALAPIRYYKLDDTSTTAADIGSQAQNGTLHGGIKLVPGLIASRNGQLLPLFGNQPDTTIDYFNANSLANYTNTAKSGGSTSTVTYDTANSRVSLVGGSGGLYLYTAISDNDVDLIADMDRSDAGGLVWRYVDTNNYYELGAYDDSSSGGFTNQLRLYKVVAGTRSLIGSASTVVWPRSTLGTSPYKRLRVTMLGTTITVYFDGTVMQTATDSAFASGKMGLRNDAGTSRYYQLRLLQVGDYVSGTPIGDTVTAQYVYTQVTLSTTDPAGNPQIQDLTTSANSPDIASGAVIPQLHDPTKPFSAFYNAEMDSITQSSGDYYWAVNGNALTFAGRHAVPAPWILHSSDLLFTPSVKPTFSADLYRNRQSITNCLGTVTVTGEQKIADGIATSWQMAYPLYSAPTITVQGVSKLIGVQGVDTGKDLYWQAGSPSISQDSKATTIPSGSILSVNYVGQFFTTVTRNNLPEQAARKAVEGGTGIVEATEDGKQMLVSAATTYADGLLARFSNNATVEIQITTRRSGLQKGQEIATFIPEHNIFDAQLLITKVVTIGEQLADGTIIYEYGITATNGQNLNKWSSALGL